MMAPPWFTIDDLSKLDSPALVIYPARVKENINILKSMIGDVNRLRPHVKTHKTIEAAQLMLDAGIYKFKCATIAEAEMLGMCKAPDVLLAYQPVGPKLERFIKLIQKYNQTQYSCLVDNQSPAREISEAAVKNGIIIPVFIDLNVGMNRTGISPDQALQLYIECHSLKGLKPAGLHAYDGHIHEASYNTRLEKFNRYFPAILELKEKIVREDYNKPVIVAGGTPTFPILAQEKDVECSPGTFIFWDKGYEEAFPEQKFLTAALLVTRVISFPDETKICIDLGHKSVAAENELSRRVVFLNAPDLMAVSQSEEHLVLEAGSGHGYKIGDVLYGLPVHICPTCALYERAFTIENKRISSEWKIIARDRKITI